MKIRYDIIHLITLCTVFSFCTERKIQRYLAPGFVPTAEKAAYENLNDAYASLNPNSEMLLLHNVKGLFHFHPDPKINGIAEDVIIGLLADREKTTIPKQPPDISFLTSFDAFSDEPPGRMTLICTLPSSNLGKKLEPNCDKIQIHSPTSIQAERSRMPPNDILKRMR